MVVRNTFCKRIVIGYGIFFFTVILIWRHHEKSIKLEEDEDTLKPVLSPSFTNTTSRTTTTIPITTTIIPTTTIPTTTTITTTTTTTITTITTTTTTITTTIFQDIETKAIDQNRLDYWLNNNSRTLGINLTAILASKRPRKYLVYVCHENCGGNYTNYISIENHFFRYCFRLG
jgi:hypothetical protein